MSTDLDAPEHTICSEALAREKSEHAHTKRLLEAARMHGRAVAKAADGHRAHEQRLDARVAELEAALAGADMLVDLATVPFRLRIQKLEAALQWFADEGHYEGTYRHGAGFVDAVGLTQARAALLGMSPDDADAVGDAWRKRQTHSVSPSQPECATEKK